MPNYWLNLVYIDGEPIKAQLFHPLLIQMTPSFPPVDDALALLPALLGAVLVIVALFHALAIRAQGQPAYIRHLSAQGYSQRRIAARLGITRYAVRIALWLLFGSAKPITEPCPARTVISLFAALKEPQNRFGLSMRAIPTLTVLCVARRVRGLITKPLTSMVGISAPPN